MLCSLKIYPSRIYRQNIFPCIPPSPPGKRNMDNSLIIMTLKIYLILPIKYKCFKEQDNMTIVLKYISKSPEAQKQLLPLQFIF